MKNLSKIKKTAFASGILSILLLISGCLTNLGGSKTEAVNIILEAPPANAADDLRALQDEPLPARDLADLSRRFKGVSFSNEPTIHHDQLGDTKSFWVKNIDTNSSHQIEAQLFYQSVQLNMWGQTDLNINNGYIEAVKRLEQEILPRDRELFGEEWRPGIDGDERVHILHVDGLGQGVVGAFSGADEYPAAVNPFSNEREILYINIENAPIGSNAYFEVVAHELQHMIQWHRDQNEAAWVNEGLAVLAAKLNGYEEIDYKNSYVEQTDIQLTAFSLENSVVQAHYGAAFLLMDYYVAQFGRDGLTAIVDEAANGIRGFEAVLPNGDFDKLFADWAAATYIQSRGWEQSGLQLSDLDLDEVALAQDLSRFPQTIEATVSQYGVDHVRLRGNDDIELEFTGGRQLALMPASPHSGNSYFTTIPADNSDATLTRRFDLSDVDAATLRFWSWYNIESGWDYAYVAISDDDGASWTPLQTLYSTRANPQGNSFGLALTGHSGTGEQAEWVEQFTDISAYTGGEVLIRFEYVTDEGVALDGLAIDDVSIPEIDYSEDFESSEGGWEGAGFVRHGNILPASFLLQLILKSESNVTIERLSLSDDLTGSWTIPLASYDEAILLISGNTRVTRMPASYRLEIQ